MKKLIEATIYSDFGCTWHEGWYWRTKYDDQSIDGGPCDQLRDSSTNAELKKAMIQLCWRNGVEIGEADVIVKKEGSTTSTVKWVLS